MNRYERTRVDLDVTAGRDRVAAAPQSDDPFCIAIIGDFSGRAHQRETAGNAGARKLVSVDRDNVDDVMARFAPRLRVPVGEGLDLDFQFRSLDDFHPDQIYRGQSFFRTLADPPPPAPVQPQGTAPPARLDAQSFLSSNMVDRMVAAQTGTPGSVEDPLAAFLRKIAAPYIVPSEDPTAVAKRELNTSTATAAMRAILQYQPFRALESLWRAVDFLVRRLETDSTLRIYLINLTRADVEKDPPAFARHLAERAALLPGGAWSALIADWSFSPADAPILSQLGTIAQQLGAPLLAAAHPSVAGVSSFESLPEKAHENSDPDWHTLRRSPVASSIGLALPRFLLRLPYGKASDPCEAFPFEELSEPPTHEEFLWGNAAFTCALLLGEAFIAAGGWRMRPGTRLEIAGLPLHTYAEDGDTTLKPCAETLMTDRLADQLMEAGLMPLATIKHGDTVRLVRFQSIAEPLTALQGPWSRVTGS